MLESGIGGDKADLNRKMIREAMYGDSEEVIDLLRQGADVNSFDNAGLSALHYAASQPKTKVLEVLLAQEGLNINLADKRQHATPLHSAIFSNRIEAVKQLLAAKASLDKPNRFGELPIHLAVRQGFREIVETLIKEGSEVTTPIRGNAEVGEVTPLDIAKANDDLEMIALLEKAVADIAIKDKVDNKCRSAKELSNLALKSNHLESVSPYQRELSQSLLSDSQQSGLSPASESTSPSRLSPVEISGTSNPGTKPGRKTYAEVVAAANKTLMRFERPGS